MKRLWLFSLCAMLVLSGCTNNQEEEDTPVQGCDDDITCPIDGTSTDMSAYEGFDDTDHHYIQITMQDAIQKLETDASGIFLFSFVTCPWCVEAIPILNEVAKEENQYIYYIDKRAETSDEASIIKMEEILKDILQEKDGKPTLFVPEVISVKDGEVIAHHSGTVDDHDAHERKMTSEEQATLKQSYQELLETLN